MLDILAEFLAEYPPYNKIRDYLAIRKDELKEEAFEKFYKTLIVDFINWQPGLAREQAEKFFADSVTIDGVLAYLYNFTDPDSTIRDNTKAALCEWANRMRLSGGLGPANASLRARFLARLEEELRRDANKSLRPYFADIRRDIVNAKAELQEEVGKAKKEIIEKLEGIGEQWEKYAAEQKARDARATQIDPSGEQLISRKRRPRRLPHANRVRIRPHFHQAFGKSFLQPHHGREWRASRQSQWCIRNGLSICAQPRHASRPALTSAVGISARWRRVSRSLRQRARAPSVGAKSRRAPR